ncbi:MAG: hypothetical protein Ct9H300mP19_01480 [Dehalococcoidia bacterium]|nr:MAG: hypothetical protein Ct9H300mP19_01480 [Dehalococcoidia bacterium]
MGDSTDELISLSEAVAGGTQPDAREMDTLLSTGELVSSTLMAMALKARGCDSISLSGKFRPVLRLMLCMDRPVLPTLIQTDSH